MTAQGLPDDLVARTNMGDVVFFLGAGCSMEAPARLPSAAQLADILISKGYGEPGQTLEQVAEVCQSYGPGTLSQALPKAPWRARPCNSAHEVLAELGKEGLVGDIVTTNWDTLIELGLRLTGVPYTPVVNPESLREGGRAGDVRVAKLQGCIDHSEEALRATEAELQEWGAEWAESLFGYLARTNALVFVGYSGAAESVTVLLAALTRRFPDDMRHYAIDPRTFAEMGDSRLGRAFLAAIGDDEQRLLQMTAGAFFSTLRAEIFPLLLARPLDSGNRQLAELCGPTRIDPVPLQEAMRAIHDVQRAESPEAAQTQLPTVLPGFLDSAVRQYVPIVPNAESLGQVWLVMATLLWAGVAELRKRVLRSKSLSTPLTFLVSSAGGMRRDIVCLEAARLFAETHDLRIQLVHIVLGDMGPLPEPQLVAPSVARPHARPTAARSAGPECRWVQASAVLSAFGPDADTQQVSASIQALFDETAGDGHD